MFELTVSDPQGLSSTDTISVSVEAPSEPVDAAPIAVATDVSGVLIGEQVTLDASGSSDPDPRRQPSAEGEEEETQAAETTGSSHATQPSHRAAVLHPGARAASGAPIYCPATRVD